MTGRGIIFDAESVRGILAGTKTQTRRVVKPQPEHRWNVQPDGSYCRGEHEKCSPCEAHLEQLVCPYGAGAALWVREVFARVDESSRASPVVYRAGFEDASWAPRWRSPIYMPGDCARIDLRVGAVRVERLQDISEADARAEGVRPWPQSLRIAHRVNAAGPVYDDVNAVVARVVAGEPRGQQWTESARQSYAGRWDAINAKRGFTWASNPWVWAITFERVRPAGTTTT